ncbi:MAG: hypothetical protein GYB42_13570 [Alphaproteobacteria bacterium]|nr:hypothetical protein [Alphaproteobacteria bacterium]
MPRRLIALLIAIYAIAFAFGAMAAIRWPSLMMFASLMLEQEPLAGLAGFDWRQIGILYGAPYFLAALCLYASALCVHDRKKGSLIWYVMGCIAGFPCAFLVDFEPGWWHDPSAGEGAVAGAAGGAVLLAIAVWNLRKRYRKPIKPGIVPDAQTVTIMPAPEPKPAKKRVYRPVPPAIARQRAHFAAEGRRMRERQAARRR